ncbi:hypothetical protein [Brachybacterium paraconglomeratum]|uniref:hypothetical protein n=1 Tax=Brachybacterium paraconglomeratum TaxID=173362 RepID=UPI002492A77E|nr:hypothetical protein [Brachybacterium paraconglomeratum]
MTSTAPTDPEQTTPDAAPPAPAAPVPAAGGGAWKIPLPDGAMPCGFCGVAVPSPGREETYSVIPIGTERHGQVLPYRGDSLDFAACGSCTARHREAARVLAAHPSVRARFGTDNAQHRLSAAFDVCAVLGVRVPARLEKNRDLTVNMIMMLTEAGVGSRWTSMFVPVVTGWAGTAQCAPEPWAHVDAEWRRELRAAFLRVLAFRFAQSQPDQEVPCPDPGGCMLCGVGAVAMPATRVAVLGGVDGAATFAWTARSAVPSSIGGKALRGRVDGYTCPTCERAVTEAGSFGIAAMGRSLAEHLDRAGKPEQAKRLRSAVRLDELAGLVAHGVGGGPASREPWEHVRLGDGLS